MKNGKYFFVIFVATLVYVGLSFSVGQNSIHCYRQMENQKKMLSKHTTQIQNINSELTLEKLALQNDKAVIAAYARRLDYVSDGEKIVKITGLKPVQSTIYDIGSVMRHKNPVYLSEKYCKILALFFGTLSFFIIFLYDISKGNFEIKKKEAPFITGVPVYDLQQV